MASDNFELEAQIETERDALSVQEVMTSGSFIIEDTAALSLSMTWLDIF